MHLLCLPYMINKLANLLFFADGEQTDFDLECNIFSITVIFKFKNTKNDTH